METQQTIISTTMLQASCRMMPQLDEREAFQNVLSFLGAGDYSAAAKWMGVTTHYVDDVAVFSHVMGQKTDWGAEKHHDDYEEWANRRSNKYESTFTMCLQFNGELNQSATAYDSALKIAHDTTFDDTGKGHTAKWMDTNYDPLDSLFQTRVCESINLAVNVLASLIYSAGKSTNIPEFGPIIPVVAVILLTALTLIERRSGRDQFA